MTSLAVHRDQRTWALSTTNTTYAVRWTADDRLVQLYWGPRLSPAETELLPMDTYLSRPYDLPLEVEEQLPVDGGLRWGVPTLQITFPGGIRSLELDLVSDLLEQEDGGQRMDLVLADRFVPLQVVLHYRTREDSDVIERWTALRHTGAEGEAFTITRADSGNWLIPERADYRYDQRPAHQESLARWPLGERRRSAAPPQLLAGGSTRTTLGAAPGPTTRYASSIRAGAPFGDRHYDH
jgi:alpha-galactosidase